MISRYIPTEKEEYMNPRQLYYFESKLLQKRSQILHQSQSIKQELKQNVEPTPDMFDKASNLMGLTRDIHDIERQRLLLSKIDYALIKIKEGEYGYCEATGEEIGLKRLEVQPFATLCLEAQEMSERNSARNRKIALPLFDCAI